MPAFRAARAASAALSLLLALSASALPASAPKFVLHVIVDDLGWGDVSFHATSSSQVVTPRMHSLATEEGSVLGRFYVHQMCTPSRSSFMSGRLPMHVQNGLPNPEDSICGVPFNMTGLGVLMKSAGYDTAWVGKWVSPSKRTLLVGPHPRQHTLPDRNMRPMYRTPP
jgi:arylsulfatase I/J